MPVEFLNGEIAIHVTTQNQSKHLIKLAKENDFLISDEDGFDEFTEDSYIEYPYYFIENDYQLNATMEADNVYHYNIDEICEFSDIFGNID